MNFFTKSLLAVAVASISGGMSVGAAAAGTLTYDFKPFGSPDETKDYKGEYGFQDGWGTTYGEGQRLYFTPNNDKPLLTSTGNPLEVFVRGREGNGANGQVRYNRAGLAVKSDENTDGSAGTVDGADPGNESLIFGFSQEIKLVSATFLRAFQPGEETEKFFVQVRNDGGLVWQANGLDVPKGESPFLFESATNDSNDLFGDRFRFTAIEENSGWTMTSLTVEKVPEPASVLGVLAIGALSSLRLRRKQAA